MISNNALRLSNLIDSMNQEFLRNIYKGQNIVYRDVYRKLRKTVRREKFINLLAVIATAV